MDKLRAIQYFNHAAESGSFASAARSMNVSAPAVVQLVGALERSLGRALFHRTTQGLTLTADGDRYYTVSRQIVADLRDVEQRLGPRGAPPRGTLVVGMRPSVAMTARFRASDASSQATQTSRSSSAQASRCRILTTSTSISRCSSAGLPSGISSFGRWFRRG